MVGGLYNALDQLLSSLWWQINGFGYHQ